MRAIVLGLLVSCLVLIRPLAAQEALLGRG